MAFFFSWGLTRDVAVVLAVEKVLVLDLDIPFLSANYDGNQTQ